MDPKEPGRNDENGGFSKRRLSSILKPPRKSVFCSEPAQQDFTVELCRSVEKRVSRRVSFAAADNVVVFSKDVKNSGRSPLQELMTTSAAPQNRLQVVGSEEASQQIKGMETLLNAPLHHSRQHEKSFQMSTGRPGDRTMMFDDDDAIMDMTHSHTINIAQDVDVFMGLPQSKTTTFTLGSNSVEAAGVNMDFCTSPSLPELDPEFRDFLSSLSKPSGFNIIPRMTPAAATDKDSSQANVCKKNQAPCEVKNTSVNQGHNQENSLRQTEESDDATGEDDPFSFLLPSKETLKAHEEEREKMSSADHRAPCMTDLTSRRKSTTPAYRLSHKVESGHAEKAVGTDPSQNHKVHISSASSTSSTFTNIRSSLSRLSTIPHTREPATTMSGTLNRTRAMEETILPDDQELSMDLTEAQTGPANDLLPKRTEESICDNDVSMDLTEAQTGRITEPKSFSIYSESSVTPEENLHRRSVYKGLESSIRPSGTVEPKVTLVEDHYRERTLRFSAEDACMDVTKSHTTNIAAHLVIPNKLEPLSHIGDKTIRFNADDADMDVTKSDTTNLATHLDRYRNEFVPSEKTVRFHVNEGNMDITRCLTVNIDAVPQKKKIQVGGEKKIWFDANDAAMEMTQSHTANIAFHGESQAPQSVPFVPSLGEKTVRFNANNAEMDMTRSHTVQITNCWGQQKHQSKEFSGERTTQFQFEDGDMDITKCRTVNIVDYLDSQKQQSKEFGGEKTKQFQDEDSDMDITKCRTVNFVDYLESQKHQSKEFGEGRTKRFQAEDTDMDITKSRTVNMAAYLDEEQLKQDFWKTSGEKALPNSREKTQRFNDASMEVTKVHTVNIEAYLDTHNLPKQDGPTQSIERMTRSQFNDTSMDIKKNHTLNIVDPQDHIPSPASGSRTPEALTDTSNPSAYLEPQTDQSKNVVLPTSDKTLHFSADDGALDVTKSHTVGKAAETQDSLAAFRGSSSASSMDVTFTHNSTVGSQQHQPEWTRAELKRSSDQVEARMFSQSRSLTAFHSHSALLTNARKVKLNVTISEAATESSSLQEMDSVHSPLCAEDDQCSAPEEALQMDQNMDLAEAQRVYTMVKIPGSEDPDELHEERNSTKTTSLDDDISPPFRKSRRKSLVDLQTKVKRLSHMISIAPKDVPLPDVDPDVRAPAQDKYPEADHKEESLAREPRLNSLTPLNLKTKALMSRVSVGHMKPKLPSRRSVADDKTNMDVVIEDRTGATDHDVSDINDEELGSYEDVSESLDVRSPYRITEKSSPVKRRDVDIDLDLLQEQATAHGRSRGLLEDEGRTTESMVKPSMDATIEEDSPCHVPHSKMVSGPSVSTQRIDMSGSSYAGSRSEAMFEPALDCTGDVYKKLEDVDLTGSEFLKLFHVDCVINNPRQSVPGILKSDGDSKEMLLLKERHVLLPQLKVYECDYRSLLEKVEQLKVRKEDLDKPLRMVNQPLLKEIKTFTEQELKSFSVKLKEHQRFFSKMAKEKSHEMKESLYSELLRAHEEEELKVKQTMEDASEIIEGLDECIAQIEAEIAAVEETSVDNKPSMKCLQEDMLTLTQTLDQNNKLVCELETQNSRNSATINKLMMETKNLESQEDLLHLLSEWRMKERTSSRTLFTFLHGTLQLEVAHEGGDDKEKKVTNIDFTFQLDEKRSQDHALLVHRLVTQHLQAQTCWTDKYPTCGHVPKLLDDVGLVVSRCRLLGEEVRLLRMWGGLRLDILDISCRDTCVHVLFSSLKKFSKFEVVLSASIVDHNCVFHLFSFRNLIGDNRLNQVNDVVTSVSPGWKLLTRIVKKIHDLLA